MRAPLTCLKAFIEKKSSHHGVCRCRTGSASHLHRRPHGIAKESPLSEVDRLVSIEDIKQLKAR